MKKAILLSSILCLGAAPVAMADDAGISTNTKQASVVIGSFVTGFIAGGPLGGMAGLVAGDWLGKQVIEADQTDAMEEQLAEANNQLIQLTEKLARAEITSQQFAQIALDQLQLELLFKTGDSALTLSGQKRMAYLADFLVKNPALNIRLDGYADPRGDADYNLTLSGERVRSVAQLLAANGVDQSRIDIYSHGASQSKAINGDYDSYAMERVVKIQLTKGDEMETYAQVTIAR